VVCLADGTRAGRIIALGGYERQAIGEGCREPVFDKGFEAFFDAHARKMVSRRLLQAEQQVFSICSGLARNGRLPELFSTRLAVSAK